MQIKINPIILLFLILFVITNQIEMYAFIMIFALIHELAHLLMGALLGFEANTLKMMPFGFSIEFKTKQNINHPNELTPHAVCVKKILVALAGPMLNLCIVMIGSILHVQPTILYANLLLFIFNMLPIYPLDGGRILKNILKLWLDIWKVNEYVNILSNTVLIILTILFSILIMIDNNIALFAMIIYLWIMILKENKKYHTYRKIYKTIDKSKNYL